jgi:hypothetical protein
VVIKDILQESRSLYQTQYDQAVARLIHIPKGSLRIKVRKGSKYYYLRRYSASKGCRDEYIGQAGNRDVENFSTFVGERKQRVEELKAIKHALNQLGVKNVELQEKGYHKIFTALLEAFGEAGLWNEGLMLIGSWCFNIYTQAFGVDYFPLRTMDFDFGLRIPYTGGKTNMDHILTDLGFIPKIDMAYGKVDYVLPGVGIVELFIDREQGADDQIKSLKRDLSISPLKVSNLQLLIKHPVNIKIHGVHKAITVPSMPAFFVHRLITASFGEYRDIALQKGKIRKDFKQAALVAKKIVNTANLKKELKTIVTQLNKDLSKMLIEGAKTADQFVKAPDLTVTDIQYINMAMKR